MTTKRSSSRKPPINKSARPNGPGGAETPLPAGEVERAAARSGYDADRAAEHSVLRNPDANSLGGELRRLIALGHYTDPDAECPSVQEVQRKWAIATLRAVAIAVQAGLAEQEQTEIEFDGSDAASALAGVITILEQGIEIERRVQCAGVHRSAGGAS